MSTTLPGGTAADRWGDRILAFRRASARTLGLVAVASFAAGGPGPAWAADEIPSAGWSVGTVRFESLEPGPGGLTVAGTGSYRGAVEVRRNGGSLAVVNEVAFEDYVRGIDEVPPSWPAAALRAQAIAARTYAAHWAASTEGAPWRAVGADICATPRCQVYRGLAAERKAAGHGWLAAVEATAGRLLLEAGRPIFASYNATSDAPRSMSQNGARDMAAAGRSTAEILNAYYGVRPTLAPGRIPATIRVAVDLGSAAVRISATEPFRVLDGQGSELAARAAGEWRMVPDPGGVRVVPPEPHRDAVDRPGAAAGQAPPLAPASPEPPIFPARVLTATTVRAPTAPLARVALFLSLAAGTATVTLARRWS